MKYGKFINEKRLPLTEDEIKMFKVMFNGICKKYSYVELDRVSIRHSFDNLIVFEIMFKTVIKKRNIYGNRITAYSVVLSVSKNSGYLDNYNWANGRLIDPAKERKDYASAPAFQYNGNVFANGTETKYRCRNLERISGGHFFYGTELSDFANEIDESLCNIFRRILM